MDSTNEKHGIVKDMEQNWQEFLKKQLKEHHDDSSILEEKRSAFYTKREKEYQNEGREKEEIQAQLIKEIRNEVKKRNTPDLGNYKTAFNTAYAGILISILEVIQLLFTKNMASLSIFSILVFLAFFFALIRLIFKKIRFSKINLIVLGTRTSSFLATLIQFLPFITKYSEKIRMPNYTFPGYIVSTELLKEGSSASPLTRTVFLTDLLFPSFLASSSLSFISLKRQRPGKILTRSSFVSKKKTTIDFIVSKQK